LTTDVRRFLMGKRYIAEKKLVIDKRYKSTLHIDEKAMRDCLIEEYGITPAQLKIDRQYARALEKLSGIVPVIYKKVMEGSISLAVKQTIKYSKLSEGDIKELSTRILEKPCALNQIIRGRPRAVRLPVGRPKKKRMQAVDITAVNKQDSNDEVLSLASTVPAWTKAIGRVITGTDFAHVSESAIAKLTKELLQLTAAINTINEIVKEHENVGN